MPGIESRLIWILKSHSDKLLEAPKLFNQSLLVLFVLCDCPEKVGKLLVVVVGDRALRAVADHQGPVMFGDSSYRLHRVGASRA